MPEIAPCSSMDGSRLSPVFVIILNWNGWRDTIECLASLLQTDYPDYHVVVVDNGSVDGSVERICAWASRTEPVEEAATDSRRLRAQGVSAKPMGWRVLDAATADCFATLTDRDSPVRSGLTVIQTGANLGYAGGNNVGIRYALAQGAQSVWILNNDTVVDCRALSWLARRMVLDPTIGLCGCTLLDYREPHAMQAACGARFDYRTGRQTVIGQGLAESVRLDAGNVEESLSYVSGASVMATRAYLQDVGLMNESYFLYFEELDWAIRGQRLGFRLGYAREALVYHKQGASIGSGVRDLMPTPFAQYFHSRSLLLMTSLFYRPWLPAIWLRTVGKGMKFLLKGHHALARAVWLAVRSTTSAGSDPDRAHRYLNEDRIGPHRS